MKNILSFIFLSVFAGGLLSSCRKADPVLLNDKNEMSDIFATLEGQGGQRLFEGRISNDTVYMDIPWFYPEESDNEVDLTKMILNATVPLESVIQPSLGTVRDLTQPFHFEITSGTGEQRAYVVIAKRVGDLTLKSMKVTITDGGIEQDINGIIQGNEVIFYAVPGTDLSSAAVSYEINKHSTASVSQGAVMDLSQPKTFTVNGIDGSSKVYTLKVLPPVKLPYGIGITRKLWSRTATELSFTTDQETALAVSGDHLVLASRTNPSRFRIYNRYTAAYISDMVNPFPAGTLSFQTLNDQKGNILICSWAPKNGTFTIYKYTNALDENPVKLLQWVNNNPNGLTTDGGVGRKVNMYGDVDGDAVIMSTAGLSDVAYKWTITGGALVSNTPEVVIYKSRTEGSNMGYYGVFQPVSAGPNTDYFVSYQFEMALVSGATNERIVSFKPSSITHSTVAYTSFNNANYLIFPKYMYTYDLNRVFLTVYDVTNRSLLSLPASDPNFSKLNVFTSPEFSAPVKNGNGTSAIAVGFSADGNAMQVYMLLTNGGILAYEFTLYAP